jgi:hypothetical protein
MSAASQEFDINEISDFPKHFLSNLSPTGNCSSSSARLKAIQNIAIFHAGWGLTERPSADRIAQHAVMYVFYKKCAPDIIQAVKNRFPSTTSHG